MHNEDWKRRVNETVGQLLIAVGEGRFRDVVSLILMDAHRRGYEAAMEYYEKTEKGKKVGKK